MRAAAFLFFILFSAGRADTLDFRNGITLTGKFLSIDAEEVRFQIDGKVKSYARSQVSKINFGPAEAQPPVHREITPGQTIDEVTALLGKPNSIVDVGAKKIYVYSDFKITFVDGIVTAVE
jgi:hypothetical protein